MRRNWGWGDLRHVTDSRSPGEIQVLACISLLLTPGRYPPPLPQLCVKNIPLPPLATMLSPRGPKFESRQINPDFNVLCHLSNIGSGYSLCLGYIPHPSVPDKGVVNWKYWAQDKKQLEMFKTQSFVSFVKYGEDLDVPI